MELGAQAGVERRCWPHGAHKTSPNLGDACHCQREPCCGEGDADPPCHQRTPSQA
jgi:hypothetical protein